MEVNTIKDVIIPQKAIGADIGWEQEIAPIIEGYAYHIDEEPAAPASPKEISACEKRLNTTLPEDLKLFYLRFGPAKLGEILCPLEEFVGWSAESMESYTAEEQEVLKNMVVFGEYLGNGNVWCFHKQTKAIYYFDHDTRPTINGMFSSFYEYLRALLIFTQGEMGSHIEGLEDDCEAIVASLVGQERVRKWRYFGGWG
ncbi:SMI1/KNR4 family protein [Hymenobacter sp.]|jgi:hypothetical protein|uniref:SMI1/KNR4 family protein n=1 Tax=Hymenobacter sp. TaxID=1898978 RepID=UPI002ED92780